MQKNFVVVLQIILWLKLVSFNICIVSCDSIVLFNVSFISLCTELGNLIGENLIETEFVILAGIFSISPLFWVSHCRRDVNILKLVLFNSFPCVIAACGHVSCFWCVHRAMSNLHESRCPICRQPYGYFPTICQMLHFLLLKMYPVAYKTRETYMLGEVF